MPQEDVTGRATSRTSSPSLSDRVRSFAGRKLRPPSTTRTVSADDADTEAESTVDSEDGQLLPQRIKSDPSAYRNENLIQSLDSSKPIAERLALIKSIAKQPASYRLASMMKILGSIEDLSSQHAFPEAREAVFDLAQAVALHPEQSSEGKAMIFAMVITPIDSQHLVLQTKCLQYITVRGTKLETFAKDLVLYVNQGLRKQPEIVFNIRKELKKTKVDQLRETRGLYGLLKLAGDVVKNSPQHLTKEDQAQLLNHLLAIAENTTSASDMKAVVPVLNASIQSWGIPVTHINMIVEVLCAISSAVPELREEIKNILLQVLKSEQQAEIVSILLQTLALSPHDRHMHTVCGTLSIVRYLVECRGDQKLPVVSFAQFIESFWKVHFASRQIRQDCLSTIAGLLEQPELETDVLQSNWQHMIETILTATGDETYTPGQSEPLSIQQRSSSDHSPSPSSEASREKNAAAAKNIYESLKRISTVLNSLWPHLVHTQRLLLARFHRELCVILPSSCLNHLVRRMTETSDIRPSDIRCRDDAILLANCVLAGVDSETYCEVISEMRDILTHEPAESVRQLYWAVAERLLKDYGILQKGWKIAKELAGLVVGVWRQCPPPDIEEVINLFRNLFTTAPDAESELSGVTTSLVDLFFLAITEGNNKLMLAIFHMLIHDVVRNSRLSAVLRLPALQLLFSLRCNCHKALYISTDSDALDLTDVLSTISHEAVLAGEQSATPNDRNSVRKSRSKASSIFAPLGAIGRPKEFPILSSHSSVWWYSTPRASFTKRSLPTLERALNFETIRIPEWTISIISILEEENDWEVLSYVLAHLPSQLSNTALFEKHLNAVQSLLSVVLRQLLGEEIREPPAGSGVKKGEVALCLYHTLTILMGYVDSLEQFVAGEAMMKSIKSDLVRAFLIGIGQWDRTAQICVQALTICYHVMPFTLAESLPSIFEKMAQVITQANLAADILEFLGGLARLPQLHRNLEEEDYRRVFAICLKYLEHSREQRLKSDSRPGTSIGASAARSSGTSTRSYNTWTLHSTTDIQKALPQYVFVLAYHVLTIWFLAVKLVERPKYVGRITSDLTWIDESGTQRIEEQGVVIVDMMNRAAYSDLGETAADPSFNQAIVRRSNWLVGLSIVSMETNPHLGLTQFTKRQASGTSHLRVTHLTHPLPAHHQDYDHVRLDDQTSNGGDMVIPSHFMLSLLNSAAPTPAPMKPILLPADDSVTRALSSFDRNDTVDGYKVAVIWYERGVENEHDVLAASQHGPDFDFLLGGLGKKVPLKDAQFNTQGLNRFDNSDGQYTYAWRDRVVEIIYHVPTLMPTRLDQDPNCDNKKRHIGNDYVKIIYNVSGKVFKPHIFSSAFNVVNIVVTPENDKPEADYEEDDNHSDTSTSRNQHYTVQVLTPSEFPRLSPASYLKNIPGYALSGLVRQIALYACIFCNVWQFRSEGDEYPSSWRNRLREITRLRKRHASGYHEGDTFAGMLQMGGIADEEGIALGMDISRWAGVP